MQDNLKQAQKEFNDYATKYFNQVREYQERLAKIKRDFSEDPNVMETLLNQEADSCAWFIDPYYDLYNRYKTLEQESRMKAKPWAFKSDSLLATQAEEMEKYGNIDEQMPWRHAKERGEGFMIVSPGVPKKD